jgi:hypothetical protein
LFDSFVFAGAFTLAEVLGLAFTDVDFTIGVVLDLAVETLGFAAVPVLAVDNFFEVALASLLFAEATLLAFVAGFVLALSAFTAAVNFVFVLSGLAPIVNDLFVVVSCPDFASLDSLLADEI